MDPSPSSYGPEEDACATPEMQDLASAILLALAEADKDARTAIQKQGGIRVLALMRASTISLAQVTVQSAISIAMATA